MSSGSTQDPGEVSVPTLFFLCLPPILFSNISRQYLQIFCFCCAVQQTCPICLGPLKNRLLSVAFLCYTVSLFRPLSLFFYLHSGVSLLSYCCQLSFISFYNLALLFFFLFFVCMFSLFFALCVFLVERCLPQNAHMFSIIGVLRAMRFCEMNVLSAVMFVDFKISSASLLLGHFLFFVLSVSALPFHSVCASGIFLFHVLFTILPFLNYRCSFLL